MDNVAYSANITIGCCTQKSQLILALMSTENEVAENLNFSWLNKEFTDKKAKNVEIC